MAQVPLLKDEVKPDDPDEEPDAEEDSEDDSRTLPEFEGPE